MRASTIVSGAMLAIALGALLAMAPATAHASGPAISGDGSVVSTDAATATAPTQQRIFHGREYLVPELAENTLHVDEGPRRFLNRLSFSPAYGVLGNSSLYDMRVAYNPNAWLGYEIALGHNPGESVHALLHTLSALVRYPIPWRLQPYGSFGYGMIMVFPGEAIQSDPVTKNALTAGGGLEFYVRNDVALRVEARNVTILGNDRSTKETVAYQYTEATVGLSFYRGLGQ
jgi:opacity protein-like surface antigen